MQSPSTYIPPRSFLLVLLFLGVGLVIFTVPGVFTVDEINFAVTVSGLADGSLSVPGTGDFPPSPELYGFDPEPHLRIVSTTPVFSLVGPLYGFLAYPMYPLGWRGLAAVNTVAYLIICFLVFLAVRRITAMPETPVDVSLPWIAFATFLLGGYSLEYAVGLWPHMLAVGLTTGSVVAAMRARESGGWSAPMLAGLLAGLAIGVREQNIAIAAGVGVGILIWSPRRWRSSLVFTAGLAIPVLAALAVNGLRMGFWTPLPKSAFHATHLTGSGGDILAALLSRSVAFAAKTINFSWFPVIDDPIKSALITRDVATGAYTTMGVVKKALVQSAPWIAPAFMWMVLAWRAPRGEDPVVVRELRALSLIVLPVFMISFAVGAKSIDGWSFNQRYFLELVPLGAIALGLVLKRIRIDMMQLGGGFVLGIVLTLAVMSVPDLTMRRYGIIWIPLLLAAAGCAVFLMEKNWTSRLVGPVIGVLVGWSFLVHVGDDVLHSTQRRTVNAGRASMLEEVVPSPSALFTWWGAKDATGPLLLSKDMVLLDAWADEGSDAPMLIDSALTHGRRVIVLTDGFPQRVLDSMTAGKHVEILAAGNLNVWEIKPLMAPVIDHR